jgi:hypothetical protein
VITGVNNTADKFFREFIAGVVDTGDKHSIFREYLREFLKKFETALTEYLGAWGTLVREKPEVENLVSGSL